MRLDLKVWTNKANGQMKVDLPSRAFLDKPQKISIVVPKKIINPRFLLKNMKGGNTLR